MLVGIYSTFKIFKRFSNTAIIDSGFRYKYLIKHALSLIIFLLSNTLFQINGLLAIFRKTFFYFEYSIPLLLLFGIFMFFIRMGEVVIDKEESEISSVINYNQSQQDDLYISSQSESILENYNKRVVSEEDISSVIESSKSYSTTIIQSLNFEFICCIVFGLNEIFSLKGKSKRGKMKKKSTCVSKSKLYKYLLYLDQALCQHDKLILYTIEKYLMISIQLSKYHLIKNAILNHL
jgi:hypothetical protein